MRKREKGVVKEKEREAKMTGEERVGGIIERRDGEG